MKIRLLLCLFLFAHLVGCVFSLSAQENNEPKTVLVIESVGEVGFVTHTPDYVKAARETLEEVHNWKHGRRSPFKFEFDPDRVKGFQRTLITSYDLERAFTDLLKIHPSGINNKEFLIAYVFSKILPWQTRAYFKYPTIRKERIRFALAQLYDQMGAGENYAYSYTFDKVSSYFKEKSSAVIDFSKKNKSMHYYDLSKKFQESERKDPRPLSWSPIKIRWNKKSPPKSHDEFEEMVANSLNEYYLPQLFGKVLRQYGESKVQDFRMAMYNAEPAPKRVYQLYKKRTDGKSPGQLYQDEISVNWQKAEIFYVDQISKDALFNLFQEAKKKALQNLQVKFIKILKDQKAQTGSYNGAEEYLPKLRRDALEELAAEMAQGLDTADTNTEWENKEITGKWKEMPSKMVRDFDGSFILKLIMDYQKRGRIVFPVFFVDEPIKDGGGVLKIYGINDYHVDKHLDPKDVYIELKNEIYSENLAEAQAILLRSIFEKAYYPKGGSTPWSFKETERDKILAEIGPHNASKIITIAGLIESQRLARTGEWKKVEFDR